MRCKIFIFLLVIWMQKVFWVELGGVCVVMIRHVPQPPTLTLTLTLALTLAYIYHNLPVQQTSYVLYRSSTAQEGLHKIIG